MSAAQKITVSTLDAAALVGRLRASFRTDRTRPIGWRRTQLRRLNDLLVENEDRIVAALAADLGRPRPEAVLGEIQYVKSEIQDTLRHLADWMEPEYVSAPLFVQPATAYRAPEPLGVVLVIAPWNYPILLALGPVVGALAAGNCLVLKPSEVTEQSSALLAELLPRYLDPECIAVVEGGATESTALLEQRWDHIFFTGGERVGKIVMTAAAKHLTPVTLELGGKSPCIVDDTANMKVSARRILWGKKLNAGQTCIAPDYVLVTESAKARLVEALEATMAEFFGSDVQASADYSRIVNDHHFDRLVTLMKDGRVLAGGQTDRATRYIAPTLLDEVSLDAPLMREEIFGPLLPILTVKDLDEAIALVNDRPKPLALYVFSKDKAAVERVLGRTSSGGACVNDTVQHFFVGGLGFGGVGPSGVGRYHGKHSFDVFSHWKGVLDKPTYVDPSLRYPPYSENQLKLLRFIM
jgi:aldehyde dehydrogenase (NAD+)